MRVLIILSVFILMATTLSAQLLGRIMDRAVDKATDKVEERLVEAAAEALARRMYRPIDKALDSLLVQQYRDSGGADSIDYSGFLAALDSDVDLPTDYAFDLMMDVEIEDDGNKSRMLMYFAKDGGYFAFGQPEEDGEPLMLMDIDREAILLYRTEGGDRTVMTMPSFAGWAAAGAAMAPDDEEFTIEKTGKTKKILGYTCQEYEFETEEDKGKCFTTTELPVSWEDGFSKYMSQMQSERYAKTAATVEGMVMESITHPKKKKKKKTIWKTKAVDTNPTAIVNADYRKVSVMEMADD